ncbi:hypothetical protein [Tahibacter amnicola]|uniref:Uncharacterized protein n=1 Tax=Tahibacter amnicola TaxID=2976241 RepID=A0ABY6B849_9GAMM|nr:hypothetical protein [Tahibacter amnicola]UXI66258.1 hypothetical protein N4264_16040 [Tahibacter amnicola]
MSDIRDDDDAPPAADTEYGIHDVIVSALADDRLDFPHLLHAARHVRNTSLEGLRTVTQLLRLAANSDDPPGSDLMHDVGVLVSQFTDHVEAMMTLESHADYQRRRLKR